MSEELMALIERVKAILISEGASEVYLFGSVSKDETNEHSDIDIAVSGLPPGKFLKAMGKAGDILQKPFDLIDLDEDNPFTRYLKEEGVLKRIG